MKIIKRSLSLFATLSTTLLLVYFLLLPILYVYAAEITIGASATNRANNSGVTFTQVDHTVAADGTGTITTVEIWANSQLSNVEVATFYIVSGNNLSTRDSEVIGTVTSGSKQTFAVNLDVQAGDYLGIYGTAGNIEADTSGGSYWYKSGDNIPCTNTAFSTGAYTISLHGIGSTSANQPTVSTSAASSVSFTTATLNGNLTDLGSAGNVTVSFEYGLTAGYGSTATASESPMSGTGTFHADISSLDDNTLYHFRAKAVGDGDPVYGDDTTFTTFTQSPTVTTQAATSITMDNNGVTGGTFNGNLTNLGDDTEADISFEYGLSESYGSNTTPVATNMTGAYTASIPSSLNPGAKYYYRSKAVNSYGTAYGTASNFTFTMPSFTTDAATYTSPGSATSTLNGNVTNMGVASNTTVYFQWGYDTSYGTNTSDQIKTTTGPFTQAISDFLRSVTVHFRAVCEIGSNTTYGSDQTFLIAPNDLSQVIWYQPNNIISGTTLPDRAGPTQNGVINWGANPSGISTDVDGVQPITTPIATPTTGPTTYPSNVPIPSTPPNMFDPGTPTFPGAGIPGEIEDASGLPGLFWFVIPLIIIICIGIFIHDKTKSLAAQLIIMAVVVFFVSVFHIWPMWLMVPFVFCGGACVLAGKVYSY